MRNYGNRKIKVDKVNLIDRIKENKENHIVEFKKAVIAYKKEALRQLMKLTEDVNEGQMDIRLDLITPVDNTKNYDSILEMFEWEVDDIVELEQKEFIEYVQDETDFAVSAKFSNTSYV